MLNQKLLVWLGGCTLLWFGLLNRPASAQIELSVEAVAGQPFGVGRVTARLAPDIRLKAGEDIPLEISEKSGRALYPAIDASAIRVLFRDTLGRPQEATVYFLFRGDEPLSLTVDGPGASAQRTVNVRFDANAHDQLLGAWWRTYTQAARRHARQGEMPGLVENYLTAMLSRRLNLELPRAGGGLLFGGSSSNDVTEALGLLTGAESVRLAMQKETLLRGVKDFEPADQPLPVSATPPPLVIPEAPADTKIEPIANHVPAECFYVRFGTFNNYRWIRSRLEVWGGDALNLITVRGVSYGMNDRLETQLALYEGSLAKLLGPQVIADVALIGSDTFFREGPAIGMLFHARNNFALSSDFRQKRTEALKDKTVTEKKLKIAGHEVSFLSSPDNRVRSFYAVDGDFHLVTTSQTIVRRFYEAGEGKGSLGAADEFRHARSVMPLDRNDTVFAYLSDEFFRNLVSPKYRIEMTRRLRAATDLELVELARLAATAEQQPAETINDLIAGGFLPERFGLRPDGAGPIVKGDELRDSLRGVRGMFTPIPDVDFQLVSASEAKAYADFGRMYQLQWEQMDPVILAIHREPISQGLEKMDIELHATPFAKQHYSRITRWLGPSTPLRLAPIEGDLITAQAIMSGQGFLSPGGQPYHLFGGLRDFNPPFHVGDDGVEFSRRQQDWLRGYFGAWPELGILGLLGRKEFIGDEYGYSLVGDTIWQRRWGKFAVSSFHRDLLEEVTPQIAMVEDPIPAQVRLDVADLTQAPIGRLIDAYVFSRARKISDGNLRFMASLSQQLHVPLEDRLKVAEQLLDAELVCPLSGEYKLMELEGERLAWASTAALEMDQNGGQPPKDYRSPPMEWFRGMNLDFGVHDDTLSAYVQLFVAPAGVGTSGPVFTFEAVPPGKRGDATGPITEEAEPTEELPPPKPKGEEPPAEEDFDFQG